MAQRSSPRDEQRSKALGNGNRQRESLWHDHAEIPRPLFSRPEKLDRPPAYEDKLSPLFSSKSAAFSVDEIIKSPPRPSKPSRSCDRIDRMLTWIFVPELFKIGIFLTAIYSTALSTVWLLIAIIRPHWGNFIANNGLLNPTVASIIIAGSAKSIEMSFTTVMLVCLGQHLTHKAKQAGITVHDLELRTMMLLPCAVVTQKGGFRAFWGTGKLGLLCIIAYIAATFYTTASDAIVSPRLSITSPAATNLSAYLQTSIANTFHIGQSCPNPPSSVNNINTCITTEHAGISLRNYLQYLSNWQLATSHGQHIIPSNKPVPIATFSDSIAVQGQWLYPTNYSALSQQHGRLITGSSMAMPYAGVVNATTIPENRLNVINQGSGQLSVNARAVTPVVGVTCAVVTAEELVPIVYMNWSHPLNGPLSAGDFDNIYKNETWRTNATAFDDVFEFNNATRQRPVFYSMPDEYNTEFDGEGTYRDMLYILLNSNISTSSAVEQGQYTLCGMNFTLVGGCSSIYTANNTGTSLNLNCDKNNEMAMPQDKVAVVTSPQDWVNVAAVWGRSISLGAGITDGRAATAAILTQLAATNSTFDPTQPSLPDSLAILSGGTLLQSTVDTPFDGFWPFNLTGGGPNNLLPTAVIQKFEAKVQVSDYSSGTTGDWKNLFAVVLALVVVMNIGCLTYLSYLVFGAASYSKKLGFRRTPPQRIQEDITELREVFTTAISSPAVYIVDSPDAGRSLLWKHENHIFRPVQLSSRATINARKYKCTGTDKIINHHKDWI